MDAILRVPSRQRAPATKPIGLLCAQHGSRTALSYPCGRPLEANTDSIPPFTASIAPALCSLSSPTQNHPDKHSAMSAAASLSLATGCRCHPRRSTSPGDACDARARSPPSPDDPQRERRTASCRNAQSTRRFSRQTLHRQHAACKVP